MLKTRLQIGWQRYIEENLCLIELAIRGIYLIAKVGFFCHKKNWSLRLLMQVHRTTRNLDLKQYISKTFILPHLSLCVFNKALTVAEQKEVAQALGTRILVVKAPQANGEKGVIHIKFTPIIEKFSRAFDMEAILRDYILVIEPSWTGLCKIDILQYTQFNEPIFVLAPEVTDYQFIGDLGSNLLPVSIGPGDWVNPDLTKNFKDKKKKYDIVMNANWAKWKRHYVLFEAMSRCPKKLKVVLIGVPLDGKTSADIECLANYYGVRDQLEIYDSINYQLTLELVASAKLGVLLSLKEGANKAISECLMVNVPIVLLDNHVGGAKYRINKKTGWLIKQNKLAEVLTTLIQQAEKYSPRDWALENISCQQTTLHLNRLIKETVEKNSGIWTTDIVARMNCPEMAYYNPSDKNRFSKLNENLGSFFLKIVTKK